MQTNSRGMGSEKGDPACHLSKRWEKNPMFVYWVQKKDIEKPKQTNRYSDRTIRDHFGMGLAISMESEDKDTESTYIKRL